MWLRALRRKVSVTLLLNFSKGGLLLREAFEADVFLKVVLASLGSVANGYLEVKVNVLKSFF